MATLFNLPFLTSRDDSFSIPMHFFDQNGDVVWAVDGDVDIRVENEPDAQLAYSQVFHVSSHALKKTSRYFASLLSERWTHEGKPNDPLVLKGDNLCAMAIFFAIMHDAILPAQELTLGQLRALAVVCDKYMYEGTIPEWISTCLASFLHSHNNIMEFSNAIKTEVLPDVLCIASVLNLPIIFGKASHQLMWLAPACDIRSTLSDDLASMLTIDLAKEFGAESKRIPSHLVTQLPKLLFPDPHGVENWWCARCTTVPHEERWHSEVIRKTGPWALDAEGMLTVSVGEMVAAWLDKISGLSRLRELDTDQFSFPCGRFRLRYADLSLTEVQLDLYTSVGGQCISCFKAGVFKYDVFCPEHKVCLFVN
ncbi:hypothetical protein A1O1_04697 [Capronia coronata CBS 617.96]|uniref:BTB domain-containing protein n=1 Tax=Capronia coronata CBS 617.96 TaxID=1182541 RepID=W9YDL1_9EURO|nr:uncharacterized protein A1O1_04697 [Capronia coronata CBS 617.96]EXJ87770.1 hypothetical protein A1O1_04697 [Capronia coronata CBS 617.96]